MRFLINLFRFLENVIPEKFIPDENVIGYGAFENPSTRMCLDTLQKEENIEIPLAVYQCQGGGSSAQVWTMYILFNYDNFSKVFTLTNTGQFRREISCAKAIKKDGKDAVVLAHCFEPDNAQKWELSKVLIWS
jgi:polypeptide N-acetylgalactosaminyltransferase